MLLASLIGTGWIGLSTPTIPAEDLTLLSLKARTLTAADAPALGKLFGATGEGPWLRVSDLDAAIAVRRDAAKEIRFITGDGTYDIPLRRVPDTDWWVGAWTFSNGYAGRWFLRTDTGLIAGPNQIEAYMFPPETRPFSGLKGEVRAMPKWRSAVYPDTERDWWLYLPANFRREEPLAVMVFQDGQWARNYVPPVVDHLIAAGQIPRMAIAFVPPGSNRSLEYDVVSDRYARFLTDEILPEVRKVATLREDPESFGIAGASSGAIAAFTAAWHRPDRFRKVLSWIGSYVDLAKLHGETTGGDDYPSLIRKTDRKPIRVWLQAGRNDLDNQFGNWWLANAQMERALTYMGYDVAFDPGNGFHNDAHGRATLPTALRWLWRDVR